VKTVRFLFNDAMARAIVEGRKTVTRRPVSDASNGTPPTGAQFYEYHWSVPAECFTVPTYMPGTHWCARVPASPGDLLIGRECWRVFGGVSDVRVDYRAGGASSIISREVERVGGAVVHYLPDVSNLERSDGKWHPSIHMPDWAARIRRRVVSVTVERLHDISEADAVREGFNADEELARSSGNHVAMWAKSARWRFAQAWDAIYAAKGLGWAVNPWVWRIEFAGENERGPTP
jgi:hypothetical protein